MTHWGISFNKGTYPLIDDRAICLPWDNLIDTVPRTDRRITLGIYKELYLKLYWKLYWEFTKNYTGIYERIRRSDTEQSWRVPLWNGRATHQTSRMNPSCLVPLNHCETGHTGRVTIQDVQAGESGNTADY